MHNQTMNLHHAVTIFVMILALTALIIASIAISGDIDYKESTIPASAIKDHSKLFDGNTGSSAVVEDALGAIASSGKSQGGDHLHIDGELVNSNAPDLNLLFGSSNIAGFNASGDDLQEIPVGVTSEGIRFSNLKRTELKTKNQDGYVDIGVLPGLNTNYRVNLPSTIPIAGQVLEVDTDITKLKWAAKGNATSFTSGDSNLEITANSGTNTHQMIIKQNADAFNASVNAVVFQAETGGIDIDAKTGLTLDCSDAAINIGGATVNQAINLGTAGVRTITMGNTGGATGLVLNSGTGGITLASTGTGDITLVSTGTGDITLNSDDKLLLDADGVLELNSSGGVINIGDDNVSQNINIGTAGVRTITMGNTGGATGLVLNSGTGGISLVDGTATLSLDGAGATSLAGATTVVLGCAGDMSLNSSAGVINIGNNNVNQNINIGTAGARAITLGSSAATTVDLYCSAAMSLNSSGGVINIGDDNVSQNINIGTAGARTITIGNTNTTLIDINAGAGGVDIDTSGLIEITSTKNNAESIVIQSTAGGIRILASGASATEDIVIAATGSSVNITSSEEDAEAIKINASAGGVKILSADTTNGIKIGTGTSGVPITIGHTNSETTIADDLIVTGDTRVTAGNATLTNGNLIITAADHGIVHTGSVRFSQTINITETAVANATSGIITLFGTIVNGGSEYDFIVTNSTVTVNSLILLTVQCPAAGTAVDGATMVAQVSNIGSGQFNIRLTNPGGASTSLSTHKIHFLVINNA